MFISACVTPGSWVSATGCRHSKINTGNNYRKVLQIFSPKWCCIGKAESIAHELITFIYSFSICWHMRISCTNATLEFCSHKYFGTICQEDIWRNQYWSMDRKKKKKRQIHHITYLQWIIWPIPSLSLHRQYCTAADSSRGNDTREISSLQHCPLPTTQTFTF